MIKLILFELEKIWRKRNFIFAILTLLSINVFLLWYANLSDGTTPELSAYKAMQKELSGLSEPEKQSYINTLYEDIQGVNIVKDILSFRSASGDMGKALAQKIQEDNPGIFEEYYTHFMNEDYLKYTGTLEQEAALITEVYKEAEKVFSHPSYLNKIQEKRDTLLGLSVFSSENSNSFSGRNIEKEASDYARLGNIRTVFFPSKGLVSATKTGVSDILLMLSVFLFMGGLIFEEKEKKLFFITKATPAGRSKSIISKLFALSVHCMIFSVLIYGCNLIFFAGTTGIGNLRSSIQSVAPFMESNLEISSFTFILLLVLTKALIMFAVGSFLIFTAIWAKQSFMPYIMGGILIGTGILLYSLIPTYSSLNWIKFINFIGLMKTENLYGSYLNLNMFGYPVSRLLMSWIALGLYIITGTFLCIFSFIKNKNLGFSKLRSPFHLHFIPHNSLLRHEGYKILVMNRALIILILFSFLLGYQHLSKPYHLIPAESYYQNIMLQLEGKLTPEKEELIHTESKRYEEAFAQIDRIDNMVSSGEIDAQTAETMKTDYYSETAFYPYFQKVLSQYEYIKTSDGRFIYDTGYVLFFGFTGNGNLFDWILLSCCIILALGNVFAMEYQKKSWNLLSATLQGRQKIVRHKIMISIICAAITYLITWICRYIQISKACPMGQVLASTMNLSVYREIGLDIPIFLWISLVLLSQLFSVLAVALTVLFLSDKTKNYLQALFTGVLILLIPPILTAMGLQFAGWFSLFPFYNLASGIVIENTIIIIIGYLFVIIFVLTGFLSWFAHTPKKYKDRG